MTEVRFPGGCTQVPDGRTPEQIRTGLVALGHTALGNATYTDARDGDNRVVTFSTPQGGAKGL